ncbi:MAG TPA: helix-turn-helix transcriptional regulator, partial [Prolixibacteraceae bacterium]|nr:helix-turn-helix transcriptional regulator [Prolixibacteraceae bacterium]
MQTKNLGDKIRSFREMRQVSLEELAEKAGLDPEQIRKIEEERVIPSLGPLIKIARALGVRIGTFLDDADQVGPVVVKAGQQQ